ncbi:response regulator transcription factor [Burkholderia cenocepacia]|uniref:Response regulator transcription factor n=1 Tax=Burkholderia cenocepacia TaxID=95486 RepID=A0AAW4TDP4_9BURK|nr:response regulator transcription factor [Burkholderia cenocepacia]SDR53986.1 two component transcriptional regulator, LuxR family [Burkholderia orbicola]MBR7989952.1 response regulator transcription factor [Burkholderia cenocepacia]MBR8068305.1 response regulator transcription factor [Burkholderia cenocepacia]MBR8446048.1 response regulator transcription factor [Burkholderia cenocepacia]MBR8507518.1 response regulator transcription factor [Burkholderia cenocepacia]
MRKFSFQTVLVSDRPLTLAGMKSIAGASGAIDLVGVYSNTDELIACLGRNSCDVALIDYTMRGNGKMGGLTLLGYLRRTFPKIAIVVLVTHGNPVITRSILAQGAASVVSKFDDVRHILTAIYSSCGGGRYLSPTIKHALDRAKSDKGRRESKLSPREIEVIRLYLSGLSINMIAARLSKGKQTVSAQKTNAMKKLGVKNDVELVWCATSLDLVDDSIVDGFEIP